MFTQLAEAICNLAMHLYRIGCCLDHATLQAGVYAEAYCDSFGYCVLPPGYNAICRRDDFVQLKLPDADEVVKEPREAAGSGNTAPGPSCAAPNSSAQEAAGGMRSRPS